MRVGLMTREYPPNVYGGAGVHVEYLSLELAKKIEVEVHCWGTQQEDRGDLQVRGLEPPPEVTGDTKAKFKAAVDAFALNLSQMKQLAEIDIVHTHTWYVSMAGFLAKKLYNIPFVLTTHSLEPLRAWKAEQLGSGYAMSSWMERTAILDADAIIAVSNGTKADILRAYPEVSPDVIHVIYNGIDLNEYQKTDDTSALLKYGVDPSKPYVLFVGRITRQKGVTHLVEAIPYMPPGTQVVLCAGAPDTPEIAAEMREKIEALRKLTPGSRPAAVENFTDDGGHSIATGDPTDTGHNIVWIEQMVTKQEAIQLYSHCAVFCCPSVYEPFGIINLEAMACKAPVVASAVGGILEVVVEGETGHLVPFEADPVTTFPLDADRFARDLAEKVNALLADPAKAKAFGEAGRRRVEEKFAWSAIADQTIELYAKLIAARK
ncbi:glycosyltransferase family 4 protein [Granulicella arctica]|uniref:glycosyltransferase family 4 protein n=1 Tax=Granulicella arctica TaxID=940613 RepID=UPI0021DFB437|nr:glycosyltransferase family 4 protein [Granulicella arctica]